MLIGLTGAAGAGKDTVYETLAQVAEGVERRSFADKLYESAAAALGVKPDTLRGLKRDPGASVVLHNGDGDLRVLSVRRYLQRYGTEAHRYIFGPDFWTDALDLTGHFGRTVVVTDVRFRNEALAIRHAGGVMVRVLGPAEVDADHPSEHPLPPGVIDYTLDNTRRDDDRATLRMEVLLLRMHLARKGMIG